MLESPKYTLNYLKLLLAGVTVSSGAERKNDIAQFSFEVQAFCDYFINSIVKGVMKSWTVINTLGES